MKAESEKLKSRTSLSMNDADWKNVQKAEKTLGKPLSVYLRETLVHDATHVMIQRIQAKKKGEG